MNLIATIHVGASAISMIILGEDDAVVDYLEKPTPLAHDIFGTGNIRPATIERSVSIIAGFRKVLNELGASNLPIRAVATNTLSEAKNGDVFLNRLRIACDIDLETLDDGEMTRLVFLKTRRRLLDTPSMRKRNTIVAHVGPGNTRLLLFKEGQIVRYQSYRLGSHRTWERLNSPDLLGEAIIRLIREQISGLVAQLHYDFREEKIEDLVMIGTEIQMLSPYLSKKDRTKSRYKILEQLTQDIAAVTEPERVKLYNLDYQTAGSILPALVINATIAETFGLTSLRVPGSDYEKGLLTDLAHPYALQDELIRQMIHSAEFTARRYLVDMKHARHVAHLATRLFHETQELHQLDAHDALLLEIAALLHEVGNHISPKDHELHSLYIVRYSEIFGLNDFDRLIVALITRYHRKDSPRASHPYYCDLVSENRIRVAKLSAILRIADALERTHSQRVKDLRFHVKGTKAYLTLEGLLDATAERLALPGKADLFEDLYGLNLVLTES